MKRYLLVAAALVLLTGCQPGPLLGEANFELPVNPAEKTHFDSFRVEFFDKFCVRCHNPTLSKGGVDLSSLEGMRHKPGVLKPGHPDDSLLYTTVLEGSMPPKDPLDMNLTNELKDWIEHWPH